jgi:hypothetical protein
LSWTAEITDEHHPICSSTDALLFTLVNELFMAGLVNMRTCWSTGLQSHSHQRWSPLTPALQPTTSGAWCTSWWQQNMLQSTATLALQVFSMLTSWLFNMLILLNLLNLLTSNLDHEGRAIFLLAAASPLNPLKWHRFQTG